MVFILRNLCDMNYFVVVFRIRVQKFFVKWSPVILDKRALHRACDIRENQWSVEKKRNCTNSKTSNRAIAKFLACDFNIKSATNCPLKMAKLWRKKCSNDVWPYLRIQHQCCLFLKKTCSKMERNRTGKIRQTNQSWMKIHPLRQPFCLLRTSARPTRDWTRVQNKGESPILVVSHENIIVGQGRGGLINDILCANVTF